MWIIMLMMMVPALTRKRAMAQQPNLDGRSRVQKQPRKRSQRVSKSVASVSADAPDPCTVIPEVVAIRQPSNVEVAPIGQPSHDEVAPIRQPSNAEVPPIGEPSNAEGAPIGAPSNAAVLQNVQEVAGQAPEEPVNPPRRRKQNTNKKLIKTLEGLPNGTKISLNMDKGTKAFVGQSATTFATECGIIIRNVCSMEYHRWDSIPQAEKNVMYEKLQGKFELLRKDVIFMDYVNARLREHWKRYRGELSRHWKRVGGKTNPQLARQNMKPGCRPDDWNHLCNYWEMEKTRNYSEKMEANRQKLVNVSSGGSRSIANLVHSMTNTETQMSPSPLEVYYNLHYKDKEGGDGWLNDSARNEYENICKHKQEAVDKLKVEGTTLITTAMEHEIERKAIKSVCGRKKTMQSGWEVGVGLVMRKKDYWMKEVAESSQQADSTSEQNSPEIKELRQKFSELEPYKRNYEKMAKFMSQKFPDFEGTIDSPITTEADGDDEVFTDGDIQDV